MDADTITPIVVTASVVATMALYTRAALEAYHGVTPGPYVSLLFLAPLGLMATSLPLVASVIMTIVPSVTALAMMLVSAASVVAFQAAVVSGNLRLVMLLAALNLCLYTAAAYAQMGLSVDGARKMYARKKKMADTLSAAANAV